MLQCPIASVIALIMRILMKFGGGGVRSITVALSCNSFVPIDKRTIIQTKA